MTDTTARRTQEERRGEAEQRLILAAAELVGEVGPAGVTLAGVGERAGYSRGLATHHFGSKGALMQRLVDNVTSQFRSSILVDRQSLSVLDEALGLVDGYFDALADPRPEQQARLVLWADAVATDNPDIRPAMRAADREFRAAITEALRRGSVSGDPAALATVIVGMLRGVALQAVLDDEVDLAACRAEISDWVRARLS